MSGTLLLIECGAAETRAALVDNRGAVKLWFGPARGDERSDRAVRAGMNFCARVRRVERSLNAAFVDIGDGLDGFLPVKEMFHSLLSEGALIEVEVKAPPRQNKGALLKFKNTAPDGVGPGRINALEDAAIAACRAIGDGAEKVVCDNGEAIAVLRSAFPARVIRATRDGSSFERHGVDQEIAAAFDRIAPVPGGGRLVIDEAHALTAIDVDTAGLSASSTARLREKIATAAAAEVARQITLRRIGGHVVVDFPSINEAQARKKFRAALEPVIASIKGASALSFSKSGLFSFTVPHREQSLLDAYTEPGDGAPVNGRRFTLDWCAKSVLREAEHRLSADHSMHVTLAVGEDLEAQVNKHPHWLDRVSDRFGGRLTIQGAGALKPREHRFDERVSQ